MVNYYNCYLHNLRTAINQFGFIPHWLDLNVETIYNNTGKRDDFFDTHDKFLQKYSDSKIKLAEDIINNGTYCPFFFYTDKKTGKKLLYAGKHRLYSLMLYKQKRTIPRKFLFLEYPVDQDFNYYDVKNLEKTKAMLYEFRNTKEVPNVIYYNNVYNACYIIANDGDILSNWLFDNDIKPSEIINNENIFNKFISNEFNLNLLKQ